MRRAWLIALLVCTPVAAAAQERWMVLDQIGRESRQVVVIHEGRAWRVWTVPLDTGPGPIPPGPTPGPTPEPTPDPLPPVPTPVTGPLWALLVVPSGNNVTAEQAALRTDAELRAEAKRLGITWLTFQDGESELSQKGYAPKIAETGTPVLLIVDSSGDYKQAVTKPTKPQILSALRAMRGD
jgi:hypothetical protein